MDDATQYVLSFTHNDYVPVDFDSVFDGLTGDVYLYDHKVLRSRLAGVDVEMVKWYFENGSIDVDTLYRPMLSMYSKWYRGVRTILDVIPSYKLIEICQAIRNQCWGIGQYDLSDTGFRLYHDDYLMSLRAIQDNGIYLRRKSLLAHFGISTDETVVHPKIMPYTITGRATFNYKRVNLSSLTKSNGERGIIGSRFPNGRLVEFDYDSYHIRLVADMIGYDLPDGNIHEYFGKIYFRTHELTEQQYEQSKRITFRNLYGDISIEYLSIPFFRDVESFKNELYSRYSEDGYVHVPVSNRKILDTWYLGMTKSKLFSYFVQMTETEVNAEILGNILGYLYQKRSKLILYTYDAFLIDYDPNDGQQVIVDVRNIIGKRYPVKISAGTDYGSMVKVTI